MLLMVFPTSGFAASVEQFKVSGGVHYEQNQEFTVDATTKEKYPQAIRHMTVDLNDPYTTMDVGYPTPMNKLLQTTKQANNYTAPGQQVAGAINGSFFWSSDQYYLPMYLISYRDRLINAGIISSGSDQYVNKPYAFGIDKSGKGKIDDYNLDLTFSHDGQTFPITSTDKARTNDNLILYTPLFPYNTTKTNELGIELVISNVEGGTDLQFGKELTGTVTKVRKRLDPTESVIPKDGFVLSAHGEAMQIVKDIQVGEKVSFKADIDDKWKGSSFMLTSGPHLVMDGKVNLGIDATSDRARERAPRTAIAVDKTGTKAFMVTVDGRQNGYSKGMSMKEFAEYLVSIGADRALNLDGGGSTTMGVRKPGDFNVSLYNKPSDGRERAVSTTLFAISTAPKGTPATIGAQLTKPGIYLKGTKGSVTVNGIMDNHYNPVDMNATDIKISSPQALITGVNGLNFTANQAGSGVIQLQTGQLTSTLPFEVVDKVAKLTPNQTTVQLPTNGKSTLSVTATDAKNRPIQFDSNLVKWSVTPNVGSVNAKGEFTAGTQAGKGTITATLANQSINIPVTVTEVQSITSIEKMEDATKWSANGVRGQASVAQNSKTEPAFEGQGALKLTYDFSKGETGTSAAYAIAKTPINIEGKPLKISARIFGDASKTWLRGTIVDGAGKEFAIDFTKDQGLTWLGWNYVTANIPAEAQANIKLKQIYIAQPHQQLKGKGSILIDDLKAVYKEDAKEGLFKDTGVTFRAEKEISALVSKGVIAGYADGKFGPYDELTRQQGAILLARALDLPTENVKDPGFKDMAPTMTYYKEVAAVANANIIRGKENGTKFDPNGKLTRAEMAAILQRGFNLKAADKNYFNDIKGSFAYDSINSLAHNEITAGIGNGKFGPTQNISRADFSVFLYRSLEK